MTVFDFRQGVRDFFGWLLCFFGLHRWGFWHRIKASDRPMRIGNDWITFHVDHEFRMCQRCSRGYRVRKWKHRSADREGGGR